MLKKHLRIRPMCPEAKSWFMWGYPRHIGEGRTMRNSCSHDVGQTTATSKGKGVITRRRTLGALHDLACQRKPQCGPRKDDASQGSIVRVLPH